MAVSMRRDPTKSLRTVKIFGKLQALEIIAALDSLLADPEDGPLPVPSGTGRDSTGRTPSFQE